MRLSIGRRAYLEEAEEEEAEEDDDDEEDSSSLLESPFFFFFFFWLQGASTSTKTPQTNTAMPMRLEVDKAPKRDDTLSAAVVEPNSPAQGNVRRRKGEGGKTGSTGYMSETQTWESNKEYERTT